MKKILCAAILVCVMVSGAFADVNIDALNFPDDIFREYVRTFDTDSDGVLSDEEIAAVNDIGVADMGITSLQGIEHFKALRNIDCSYNNITGTVDLSGMTDLRGFSAWDNHITAINLQNCASLEGIGLHSNDLTTIDVTDCISLQELHCMNNNLTSHLDMSHCPQLRALYVGNIKSSDKHNRLTSLNITGCTKLEGFGCDGNGITGTLDLSECTALVEVWAMSNHFTAVNLQNCTSLVQLGLHSNDISSLDVTTCTSLQELHCMNNNLTGMLDLSNCRQIREAYLANNGYGSNNNKLTSINITGCTLLQDLHCQDNNLSGAVDASTCTSLVRANFTNNNLTSLNVRGLSSLEHLWCATNNISALDVSSCSSLTELNCDENSLQSLNVSGCTALQELHCYDNSITTLNVSQNPALQFLNCSYNSLDTLTLGTLPNLYHLECDNNNLTTLDVTGLPALTYLNFRGNYITNIDLSRNTALTELCCYINQLTTLDLSHNVNLAILECRHNSLPALDLAGNPALSTDALIIRKQIIRSLDVNYDPDNTAYPYTLDLRYYVTATQLDNVIASSVKGLDSEGAEIESAYSSGVIQLALYPQKVVYGYDTGHDKSMDVIITSETFTSADKTPKKASYNNHVYQIIPEKITWQDARDYCESVGGHLLTITSQEEYTVLEDMLAEAFLIMRTDYPNSTFWVGATRDSKEWEWLNGEVVAWPTSSRSGYLTITYMGNFYAPYTVPVKSRYFICEWDESSADFAPIAPEYERYIEDPQAYFAGAEFYGAIPDPLDLSHLAYNPVNVSEFSGSFTAAATLPSQYGARTSGILPPVRNQGEYGTCWSFSSLGVLETSYNLITHTNTAPDLSELYQAWFAYRDPREGYSFPLMDSNRQILSQGGNNSMSIAFMSRAGTVAESVMPYTQAARVSEITEGNIPEDYKHSLRLKNAYRIGGLRAEIRDEVKNLIMTHGAVSISYYHESTGMSQSSYYLPSRIAFGHSVMLVGWDDDYSGENFTEKGAWLAKNSWGSSWGDSGYFWISYSQNISDCAVYVADTSGQELDCKGYDILTSAGRINYHWSANIFRAESRESIREVAFHTADNNTPYELYINRLSKDYPVNPGIPEAPVASGIMPYAGYHTLSLNTPVEVEDGEYYAVMVKLGSASTYEYVTAVEDTGTLRAASINAGESYFAKDEEVPDLSDWKDGKTITDTRTGRPCNACIKAFTVNLDAPEPEPEPQSSSVGGSGGCVSASMPAWILVLMLVLAVSKKNH